MSAVADHLAALDATAADARVLSDGLSDEQINWRPAPERWSVGECLMHLAETSCLYEEAFATAVARGRSRGLTAAGPFRPGWFGAWFAREMEPPPRRRFRAPRGFRPRHREAPARTIREAYHRALDGIRKVLHSADGLDLGRIRMRSPVTPVLRFNLESGFRIHAAHERRHLWQARQVREADDFPA